MKVCFCYCLNLSLVVASVVIEHMHEWDLPHTKQRKCVDLKEWTETLGAIAQSSGVGDGLYTFEDTVENPHFCRSVLHIMYYFIGKKKLVFEKRFSLVTEACPEMHILAHEKVLDAVLNRSMRTYPSEMFPFMWRKALSGVKFSRR